MALMAPHEWSVLEQVHRQALRGSVAEATRVLTSVLRREAAYVLVVRDVKTLARWRNGSVQVIHPDRETRLRAVYEIVLLLERFEVAEVIRVWFFGMSTYLDDTAPAQALHEGRLQEAMDAALSSAANG
jgi:hypothetical protein